MKSIHRRTAWMLLAVCLLMQIAANIPHHHHDRVFCLHADVLACETDDPCAAKTHSSSSLPAQDTSCGNDCVTRFQGVVPHQQDICLSPSYSYYSLLYIPTCTTGLSSVSVPGEEMDCFYPKGLRASDFVSDTGRRAPPVCG